MTTDNTAIIAGTVIRVSKGCKAFGVDKGVSAKVLEVTPLGADYSHQVQVRLFFLNGFKSGKTITLTARHPNRMSDTSVRLHNGDPTKNIEIVRK
jgi:hypothetical protein